MSGRENAMREVTRALARIREIDPLVNAVLRLDDEILNFAARGDEVADGGGALAGMPLLAKDNIELAGDLPLTAGSLALRNNTSRREAAVIKRVKAAGAVVLGTTNMSEWANFRSSHPVPGWSATGGLTRNPYVLDRVAGSSSCGSAVAVATGMVPAAIGTETNGSITSPASINGVVGMKPSVGLVSRHHILSISRSQGTPGPLAQSVPVAAQLLAAMAGSDPLDPVTASADSYRAELVKALRPEIVNGMRIGVMRFAVPLDARVSFEQALDVLETIGAELVDIPEFEHRQEIVALDKQVMLSEFKAGIDDYLAITDSSLVAVRSLAELVEFNRRNAAQELSLFGQDTLIEALDAPPLTDPVYCRVRDQSLRLAADEGIDRMLAQCRAQVLVGVTQQPAIKLDVIARLPHRIDGACLFSAVTGYPHLTVPMAPVRGLPVGLSFVGPKWSDARIFSVGYAYEREAALKIRPQFQASLESAPETVALLEPQSID